MITRETLMIICLWNLIMISITDLFEKFAHSIIRLKKFAENMRAHSVIVHNDRMMQK